MLSPIPHRVLTAILLLATGCSEDLVATDNGDAGPGILPITTEMYEDGFLTTVDATDRETWRYFDLESAAEVFPALPEDSSEWDLAFQRFRIQSNGGSSGTGGAEVSIQRDQTFEGVTAAPIAPYIQDSPDGDDEDADPDLAFLVGDGWYSYDEGSHILTARPIIFIVRTPESRFFKVQVLDYYDGAGTSGHLSFRWAEIDPPSLASQFFVPRLQHAETITTTSNQS